MRFRSVEDMIVAAFEALRPSARMSVTEAAEKYHIIRQPGSHNGPWSRKITPYMVEPQDLLTSLDYTGMVFVGPARTGKSVALTNWVTRTAISDPSDMLVVHMSQHTAREWSKTDLAKSLRNSPELRKRLSTLGTDDNTYDKVFISGMRLSITWPTVKNLSGKTIPLHWIMDYDRIADNIDGEGNVWELTKKRGGTFKRHAMTVAESSPGREVENPRYLPKTPHEGPPARGIMALYNNGDRRRWYWACPQCEDSFEPDFDLFDYPKSDDIHEAAQAVRLICPCCGFPMTPDMKQDLNSSGRWVRDGMVWLPSKDKIVNREGMKGVESDIASFWLKGPAAGYQDWSNLVMQWLRAEKVFEDTGDEEALKNTTNLDQGKPYISRARLSERMPEELKAAAEHWPSTPENPTVPQGTRFLVATVDVQVRSFVVQVHGVMETGDIAIVDMFKIRLSDRLDGNGRNLPCEPPVYKEDWDLLTTQVMQKRYALADGSGREMPIYMTACDSGGVSGSTANAYRYWRSLRDAEVKLHRKFMLVKGNPTPKAPHAYVSWPDSNKTGKQAIAKGDVPVVMLGSNLLKDQAANMLSRRVSRDAVPGGMIRYPAWAPDWFYTQLTNEVRTPKGWENVARRRNEAWDLLYYALGVIMRPHDPYAPWPTIQVDRIDFANPPEWAEDWDNNPLIVDPAQDVAPVLQKQKRISFADLGKNLA